MKSKKSGGYCPKYGAGCPSGPVPDMNVWKIVKKMLAFVGTLPDLRMESGAIRMRASSANEENELYNPDEEQDAADLDSDENDENYLDNFSFDINNSQTISNFSNSLDAYKNQANTNL